MLGKNVKNTIVQWLLSTVAPHPCSGCGKIGAILCEDCKYDIVNESFDGCVMCGVVQPRGICAVHTAPFERIFVGGRRQGPLKEAIDRLKFQQTKAAATVLGDILAHRLPLLPVDTTVVPLPTVRSHVRQRGYDQALLIARQVAYRKGLPFSPLLARKTSDTQHTVGRERRKEQAGKAFTVRQGAPVGNGRLVLLVDDIYTTGATVASAAWVLRRAGYVVWVAVVACQVNE